MLGEVHKKIHVLPSNVLVSQWGTSGLGGDWVAGWDSALPVYFEVNGGCYTEIWFQGQKKIEYRSFTQPPVLYVSYISYSHRTSKRGREQSDVLRGCFLKRAAPLVDASISFTDEYSA